MIPRAEYRNRFLDPAVLGGIAHLELVARTVVDGFISGLHRSPDFGFSQEFAEYRAYTPGDDLRHIDWNVFARTERAYLKRYRGDTNTQITIILDGSASMGFGSGAVKKMEYARFLAASIAYMAHQQRDAAGLIVFHEDVANYIAPSARQGQLARLYHALDHAEPTARTDFARPFLHFQQFLRRRGLVVVISDFYDQPDTIVKAIRPLRARGTEVVLFHLLDPEELKPSLNGPVLLIDMETHDALEVSAEYARDEYRSKISAHIEGLRSEARGSGLDYFLIDTSRPLDAALREYLTIRQGRM
ncbi:MAG TPA: DUF58 domain-containing protein [Bryobacteraceae bacterium]|nr:DUF58 domain-containing protein [Bryobacteraceae bacterium]